METNCATIWAHKPDVVRRRLSAIRLSSRLPTLLSSDLSATHHPAASRFLPVYTSAFQIDQKAHGHHVSSKTRPHPSYPSFCPMMHWTCLAMDQPWPVSATDRHKLLILDTSISTELNSFVHIAQVITDLHTRSTDIIFPCSSVLCRCWMHFDASSAVPIVTKP